MFSEKKKKDGRMGESLVLVFDVSLVYENLFFFSPLFYSICSLTGRRPEVMKDCFNYIFDHYLALVMYS